MQLTSVLDGLFWPKVDIYKGQPVSYYQVKYDGYGIYIIKDTSGQSYVYGHAGTDYSGVLGNSQIKQITDNMASDTYLMAEMYLPGARACDVVTAVKEGNPNLTAGIFCILKWGGVTAKEEDITALRSTTPYGLQFATALSLGISSDHLQGIHEFLADVREMNLLTSAYDNAIQRLQDEARMQRYEGYVLKKTYLPTYAPSWYKVKPVQTCDAFVIDTKESHAFSRKGQIAAFVVAINHEGRRIELASVANGFSAYDREQLSQEHVQDPSSILGRVMEVQYDSLTVTDANGGYIESSRLRFPRFLRWREDKGAAACTSDQF